MTLLIAFDDTDARDGGCTTWLAHRVRAAFPECREARRPRLVRLNPNVPWKTRGNAAVCLALDDGHALDERDALARALAVVRAHARTDRAGTAPGVAVTRTPPPRAFYERAVREIVPIADAVAALDACGAAYDGVNERRGLVGAAAALAWTPMDRTFELIAYRDPARWGTPRDVPAVDVRAVHRAFPGTFDSFDEENDEVVMVPASPCPVLWGLRGEDPEELPRAAAKIGGEHPVAMTLFESNQATDEHLVDATAEEVRAFTSVRVDAVVAARPVERGGHVFVALADDTGVVRAAAYAPTRDFRRVVAALRPGDGVRACGGVHEGPDGALTIGLEKLGVHRLADVDVKTANPACPACGKRMKSAGRGAGYRCRACGTKADADAAETAPEARALTVGWHEVPACARRHLAKPLKRGAP